MMSGFAMDIGRAEPDGGLIEVHTTATPPVLPVLGWVDFGVAERAATG